MKFFDKTVFLINIGVVLATLLAYLAPIIDPELTWTIAFFGLFYPILLLLNILFILYWVFKKPRYLWLSLACIAVGWSQLNGFIAFNSQKYKPSGQTLSFMTFNISNASYGYDKNKKDRTVKKEAFIDFLEHYTEVDILCIQEVGPYAYDILKATFPRHHIFFKDKGAIIMSKYPFISKGEIEFGTITNSCLWADIRLPGDTIRVYSYHLQSNQISKDAEKLANQKEINQKQSWYDIKGMLRKFRNRHLQRSRQAEKIADHATKSPHKIILAGDLNDPPQSYTYHIMSSLGKDAFRERGQGIGTTYAGKIPLLRIDYIFADQALTVAEFKLVKDHFSDHYAISAAIEWPSGTNPKRKKK